MRSAVEKVQSKASRTTNSSGRLYCFARWIAHSLYNALGLIAASIIWLILDTDSGCFPYRCGNASLASRKGGGLEKEEIATEMWGCKWMKYLDPFAALHASVQGFFSPYRRIESIDLVSKRHRGMQTALQTAQTAKYLILQLCKSSIWIRFFIFSSGRFKHRKKTQNICKLLRPVEVARSCLIDACLLCRLTWHSSIRDFQPAWDLQIQYRWETIYCNAFSTQWERFSVPTGSQWVYGFPRFFFSWMHLIRGFSSVLRDLRYSEVVNYNMEKNCHFCYSPP